jgi:hypothetical protein
MHDESLFRSNFQGGVPVVLADGSTWYVPRPRLLFVPGGDDGAPSFKRWNLGPEFGRMADALMDDLKNDKLDEATWFDLQHQIWKFLLGLNYAIPEAVRQDVLAIALGETEEGEPNLITTLLGLLSGKNPAKKPGAGGSN